MFLEQHQLLMVAQARSNLLKHNICCIYIVNLSLLVVNWDGIFSNVWYSVCAFCSLILLILCFLRRVIYKIIPVFLYTVKDFKKYVESLYFSLLLYFLLYFIISINFS